MAIKSVRIGGMVRQIEGLTESDPYYVGIVDDFEPDFFAFCRALIRPGFTILDIGANIGAIALMMSELAGAQGRIYAFEAAPSVFSLLKRNIDANAIANVRAGHFAVSSADGEVSFLDNSAFGAIDETGTARVPARSIDTLVNEIGVQRLDFIKIDIEGHEWQALQGAAETIARFDPVIRIEFNAWCQIAYSISPKDFAIWLAQTFRNVYLVKKPGEAQSTPLLTRLTLDHAGLLEFLSQNIFQHGLIDDLVLVNDAGKISAALLA